MIFKSTPLRRCILKVLPLLQPPPINVHVAMPLPLVSYLEIKSLNCLLLIIITRSLESRSRYDARAGPIIHIILALHNIFIVVINFVLFRKFIFIVIFVIVPLILTIIPQLIVISRTAVTIIVINAVS